MNRKDSLNFLDESIGKCKSMIFPNYLFFTLLYKISPDSKYMTKVNPAQDKDTAFMIMYIALGIVVVVDLIFLALHGRLSEMKKELEKNPNLYIVGDYKELSDFMSKPFGYGKINKKLIRSLTPEE